MPDEIDLSCINHMSIILQITIFVKNYPKYAIFMIPVNSISRTNFNATISFRKKKFRTKEYLLSCIFRKNRIAVYWYKQRTSLSMGIESWQLTKRLMVLTILVSADTIIENPGALGAEETRQSIPNLAVKLCYGDNTVGGALWKNSSAPGTSFRIRRYFLFLWELSCCYKSLRKK